MARIVVTPAEEEDEIIIAGSGADMVPASGVELAHESALAFGTASAVGDTPSCDALSDAEPAPACSTVLDSEPASGPGSESWLDSAIEPGRKAQRFSERSPGPSSEDSSRAMTLDDLEPSPMPFAQRVVIIAAIVCIIGALIYYFVAMR